MKTIGIIAEYNPFHNGHKYQIEKAKELTGADYVIIAMSGDFVQRGAPALIDKYTRAKMALSCGADLVLELPALWACSSAEFFGAAGIALLDKLGIVDMVCFGCETPNLSAFHQLADFFIEEPENYRRALSTYLKEGKNFPTARALAVSDSLPDASPEVTDILRSPNNILALEYCKALRKRESSMEVLPIQRVGKNYHDTETDSAFSSATGIRKLLQQKADLNNDITSLKGQMPDVALEILEEALNCRPLLFEDDFSSLLGFQLLKEDSFSQYADVSSDLSNRIRNTRYSFSSVSSYLDCLYTKEVTFGRLSRMLFHILLGHKEKDYDIYRNLDYVPYARVLGCSESAAPIWRKLKDKSQIPLITNLPQAPQLLDAPAMALLEKDIYASRLYRLAAIQKGKKLLPDEYQQKFLRL